MKRGRWIFLLLTASILLRLFPFLDTGLPFSPDAWPIIGELKLLLKQTPIYLGKLGSYHNYWPGGMLFSSVFKLITGFGPKTATAVAYPVVSSFSVLFFYLFSEKIFGDKKTALASTFIFAFIYPLSLWSSTVGKEPFAYPFLFLILFIYLNDLDIKFGFLFVVSSVAIVLSHQFTPAFLVGVLATVTVIKSIKHREILFKKALATSFLALLFISYQLIYPGLEKRFNILFNDPILLFALGGVFFLLIIYLSSGRSYGVILLSALFAGSVWLSLEAIFEPLVPFIQIMPPLLPPRYLIYFLPLLISVPLVVAGYRELSRERKALVPVAWLIIGVGVELFAAIGKRFVLLYRGTNFLVPSLALLAGSLLLNKEGHRNKLKVAAIILVVFFSLINFYAAYGLEEPYMGYQLKQTKYEFYGGKWLKKHNEEQKIMADKKINILLRGYYNMTPRNDDIGYNYLQNGGHKGVFFYYRQMGKNGYIEDSPAPKPLPRKWKKKLKKQDLIYNNGNTKLYLTN